jgi:4-alpha-glucanotransferase
VAIFVNYDSADVWVNPGIFELNDKLEPIRVAGVPPDYFSATGQRWGNPLYRWDVLQERSFDWWVARVRRSLALYDSIRLDHFRGFDAYWAIPATEATAVKGEWVKAPGAELFRRLKRMLRKLPFVAEDLGVITPDVEKLRDEFDMPGMVVLQFGFADRGGHKYLPHQCERNSVIYTGTHDNDTTLGWWRKTNENERRNFQTYLQKIEFDGDAVWALMRAAARSVAETCIFPLQDVLFLGSEARMNTPGVDKGNWGWRYAQGALHPDIAAQLAALMEMTDRDGYVQPPEPDIEGMP